MRAGNYDIIRARWKHDLHLMEKVDSALAPKNINS
jgi:hypothetical protein